MAFKKKAGRKIWRGVPVALKVLALCIVALVALLLILPAPPEREQGGTTVIGKYVPPLRDTVDPLANSPLPEGDEPSVTQEPPRPVVPIPPPVEPEEQSESVEPAEPIEPSEPEVVRAPVVEQEQPNPPPDPFRKPENEPPSVPAVTEESETASEAALPLSQGQDLASLPPAQVPPDAEEGVPAGLPSKADIRNWLRSQAWEFLGGVDPQGNILYRFEVWLDAPPEVLKSIKSVAYEYDAPSATPKSRQVDQPKGGFRARFGSLACSKNVTITVTMADGNTRRTTADGCRALN